MQVDCFIMTPIKTCLQKENLCNGFGECVVTPFLFFMVIMNIALGRSRTRKRTCSVLLLFMMKFDDVE